MTSDHSPVFATFEVGVASQFVSKQDPNTASQGGIQIMNCLAILLTKSKTKFFIEFHSSCLEKTMKTSEGDNTEQSDGSIKVWFGNQVELTPIISDPEYLLDQHILMCVKSTDSDESYGEGCIALRAAQFCYREFQITLTHHGEKTGTLTGGIQLRTSEGKPTEKLYDFIKIGDDNVPPKGKSGDANKVSTTQTHDISNPSYMGLSFRSGNVIDKGWSYSMPPRALPGQGYKDPKKAPHDVVIRSPTVKACSVGEDENSSEMFDNPLYGSMVKAHGQAKDPNPPQTDHLTLTDLLPASSKATDGEAERPPVPAPRNRSFTCSENRPQSPTPSNLAPSTHKKPVVPSRSEGGMGQNRPRLPNKSRQEPQAAKPRDYRDSSELPKQRHPARPSPPQPSKDMHPDVPKTGRPVN